MVDVAGDPTLGARLYQELWVRGHGYIQISKIGALLIALSSMQPCGGRTGSISLRLHLSARA